MFELVWASASANREIKISSFPLPLFSSELLESVKENLERKEDGIKSKFYVSIFMKPVFQQPCLLFDFVICP